MNIKELFKLVDENKLVMPDFQRDYVWKKEDQKALAASLLLSLPIGSFLLLDGNKDDFATKELGFATRVATPKDECKFLLDGQQRLTSLRSIFSDLFCEQDWKNTAKELYSSLKVRWFLRLIPNDGESDIFGWKNLMFNRKELLKEEPTALEERLSFETVGTSLSMRWSNPDYQPLDLKGNKIEDIKCPKAIIALSKLIAENKRGIPLYTIYNKQNNKPILLEYVIHKIAEDRKTELEAEYRDDLTGTIKFLEKFDPMISELCEDENYVKDIWSKLSNKWKSDIGTFFTEILNQDVECIELPTDEISRAVVIFERINKGGTRLDNFDLIVARAARDKEKESLNKRIISYLSEELQLNSAIKEELLYKKPESFTSSDLGTVVENEIDSLIKKQYLNLLSIFAYTQYGDIESIKLDLTKKNKILNITHIDINRLTEPVIKALNRACAFLNLRCGIVKISELNYNLMIIPLAYLLHSDEVWNSQEKLAKLEYWYWCSILSGEYRFAQNDRSIRDLQNLYKWIVKGEEISQFIKMKENVLNMPQFSDKEILIRENTDDDIPLVIEKTILQYIISRQPKDLLYNCVLNAWDLATGKSIDIIGKDGNQERIKLEVQDHHIIPLGTSTSIGESTKKLRNDKKNMLNSILNRTLILSKTNLVISNNQPIKYLQNIYNINKESATFEGHFIPSYYEDLLHIDGKYSQEGCKKFLNARYEKISSMLTIELNKLLNTRD